MERSKLKMILESLIFVSEEPISFKKLDDIIDNVERDEIREALGELERDMVEQGRGIVLFEVAGGYQFRTPAGSSRYVSKLFEGRPQRLTKAALETMAIVAYRQPIVRSEIERIRGVDSGGVLKTLLERDLIRIVGRQDVPGRPALYGTTEKFLEFFGLKSLNEMPDLKEIQALGDAAEEAIADEVRRVEDDQQLDLPLPDGEGESAEDRSTEEGRTDEPQSGGGDNETDDEEEGRAGDDDEEADAQEDREDGDEADDDEDEAEEDSGEISEDDLPLSPKRGQEDSSDDDVDGEEEEHD